MQDSVFTKIITGDIPSHTIYEDDKNIAFMDINPVVPGHVLVVPKQQIDHIWDLTAEDYRSLMEAVQKVALRVRDVLSPARVGVHIVGFDVPHAHVHLMPINSIDDHFRRPDPHTEPDHAALSAMAQKLRM